MWQHSAMELFKLTTGSAPIIFSIPHAGTFVPEDIKSDFTDEASALPDTDWYVDRLYDFAFGMGITVITATHSRYVIDLNRPIDNQELYPGKINMPLCPVQTFAGEDIYIEGRVPGEEEIASRINEYWMPYHVALTAEIERVREDHGYVVLYDAHSIASSVPLLFEGKLPDINIGTAGGSSCGETLSAKILSVANDSHFSTAFNERFIGGYITRHYGDPANNIHAVQIELSQDTYMKESLRQYDTARSIILRERLIKIMEAIT
jgi:N-formylglutamate amidohydrolase